MRVVARATSLAIPATNAGPDPRRVHVVAAVSVNDDALPPRERKEFVIRPPGEWLDKKKPPTLR
jgi:hypothetical protein